MENPSTRKIVLYLAGLITVNFIVLTKNDFLFLGTIFTFSYIMTAPGLLILPFFSERKMPWPLGLAFGVSLSALFLTLLGLATNIILPAYGITRPLETIPLLYALDIFILYMLSLSFAYKKDFAILKPELALSDKAAIAFAATLPILTSAGAIILTNNGKNTIPMLVIALIAAAAMIVISRKSALKTSSFAVLIYGIAAAILLMTSMRGYYLTGHDVQLEYQVFSLTNRLKLWDMANYQDAYNACLSITILPTYLESLLHIKDYYVYKFFFQFIGAFLTVIVFYLARNYTTDKAAFLAALLYVTFPTFLVDMAMLNRQAMALLFFGGLIFVLLTDDYFTKNKRSFMMLLLGSGMILSHYSTSYIALAILTGGYGINIILRLFFSIKRLRKISFLHITARNLKRKKLPFQIPFPVALSLVIVLAVWTGPVTKTSQNFTETLQKITASLQDPFLAENNTGAQKYSLSNAKQLNKYELFDIYIKEEIAKSREIADESKYYPQEITQKYQKAPTDEPILPLTSAGQKIKNALNAPLKGIYNESKQFYAKILQIFIFLSLLGLFLGYRFHGHLKRDVSMDYISLSAAGIFVMAMQVILPPSVIDYGLLRLFQQNLVLLALPVTLGFLAAWSLIVEKARRRLALFAGFIVAFFLIFSGFIPQLTGGGRPALTLNNSGFYYDAYYIHSGEMDALLWLKDASVDLPVQSERYFSDIRLLTYSDIGAQPRILPEATLKDSLVYFSYLNTTRESVIEFIDGDVLYYTIPSKFFDDNKNRIYDNGQSRIYG